VFNLALVTWFRVPKGRFVLRQDMQLANKTAKTDMPTNVKRIVFVCVLEYLRL